MTYTIQKNESVQVLEVKDLFNELENRKILQDAREGISQGKKSVILDLSDLKFMNSVGLNFLILLRSHSQDAGGSLSIVNPPQQVVGLLEMTKLKSFFRFNKTVDEALECLKQSEEA